jgi:aminopeptidase N
MSVPEEFVVGATGLRQDVETSGGLKKIRYVADDVHDFAWTASPDFHVFNDQWEHVAIRLLLQPAHRAQAQRHFDAAKTALERYRDWVGEYPYTTLTLVDGIGGSNGMEYPTLITCGTVYMLPSWLRALELVTIHEFGHQYFYGLIASNEFEEAWMDEGMNSYIETRIMDDAYGNGSVMDFAGLTVSDIEAQRVAYTKSAPSRGALVTDSWKYRFGDYSKASYSKPSTVMHTLERYLGWETMREFLRTYYDTWRFRHPSTRDLQDVAESVSGQDLDWFFDQYVYGEATFDYQVTGLTNVRLSESTAAPDSTSGGRAAFRGRIVVEKTGDGYFPQKLRATFDDGTTQTRTWDGKATWIDFSFEAPSRLVEAYVDPDNAVLLDTDRLNNRRVLASRADNSLARTAQLRFTALVQKFLTIASGLF